MNEPFTEREDDIIAQMLRDGCNSVEIAKRLPGRSRNSIIGRVGRVPRLKQIGFKRPPPREKKEPVAKVKLRCAPIIERLVPKAAPEPLMLSVLDLTNTTCRWPIGDPKQDGFGFCGHEAPVTHPYCDYHRSKMHVPRERLR